MHEENHLLLPSLLCLQYLSPRNGSEGGVSDQILATLVYVTSWGLGGEWRKTNVHTAWITQ